MFELALHVLLFHADEIASVVEAALHYFWTQDNERQAAASAHVTDAWAANSGRTKTFIMDMVNTALTSWGTSTYDWLQKNMNGYQ
jgi:hypothetical protein